MIKTLLGEETHTIRNMKVSGLESGCFDPPVLCSSCSFGFMGHPLAHNHLGSPHEVPVNMALLGRPLRITLSNFSEKTDVNAFGLKRPTSASLLGTSALLVVTRSY